LKAVSDRERAAGRGPQAAFLVGMILAVSIRLSLFSAPVPKRVVRTVLLLLAAALPVVAVSAL
jgi:hypothetical protein